MIPLPPDRHPLLIRNFLFFWVMRFGNVLAMQMLLVALSWQVYDVARQTMSIAEAAFLLGLIGLAQFVPLFGLTLVAGYVADRLDRRWIVRMAIALECGAAALALHEAESGAPRLWVLFSVAALLGIARAFAMPALSALAPNLVSRRMLPTAIALNSVAYQTGSVVGPALGGYVYALAPEAVYSSSVVLLLLSLALILLVGPVRRPARSPLTPWQSVKEGIGYVRHHKLLLGAISLDLFAVMLGGATAMLPVFARDVLQVGPEGLGHLRAAPAIGAVLVAAVLALVPMRRHMGRVMFLAVGAYGLATALFAVSNLFWLSIGLLIALGAADMLSVYVRSTLIQTLTPDAMRGRVAAVSSLFISASNELGEFESGLAARLIGAVGSVLLGGIAAMGITAYWARLFPELLRVDRVDQPVDDDQPDPAARPAPPQAP